MNRVIAAAGILVTVGLALRPEPRTVLLKTAEETIAFDTAAQTATVHAVLRNNTRGTTWFLGCLGVPAFAIERHVAGHWIAAGAFPCPARKAYPVLSLTKGATVTVPLRLHAPGEYRLKAVWGWHGQDRFQRHATSIAFAVR
jgi:hypothetical protein